MAPVYRPTLLLCSFLVGCATQGSELSASVFADSLVSGESPATSVETLDGYRVVLSVGDELWMLDPVVGTPVVIDDAATTLVGTASVPDGALIATSTDVAFFDGVLRTTPLDEALGDSIGQLAGFGTTVWARTPAGTFRYEEGELSTLTIDSEPATHPFAPGGSVDGERVVWASTAERLVALRVSDLAIVAERSGRVQAVATDSAGQAWAIVGGLLWSWGEAGWVQLPVGISTHLAATPDAPGAWVVAGGRLVRLDGDQALPVSEMSGVADLAVDEAGRALVVANGELWRYALERSVVVGGLESGTIIEEPTGVVVSPTDVGNVLDVVAKVDGSEVGVTEPAEGATSWTVLLDPAVVGVGAHTLTVDVSWEDETLSSEPLTFEAAEAGPISFLEHITPMYSANCKVCHDGGTTTNLATMEDWINTFDQVIEEVEAGRMPLGADPLTAGEISVLKAWEAGGFQP